MKKYLYFILCFILIPLNVNAISCIKNDYSAQIEISKNEINTLEETIITVKSNDFYKVEYEVEDKDIIDINDAGIVKGLKKGNTKINVKVNFLEDDKVVDSCTTNILVNVLEIENTLKSLNIKEYDLKDIFKSDVYHYEIKLPYRYDKITIEGTPTNEDATINGLGEKRLNIGLNEFKIKVLNNINSLTYTLSIFREDASKDSSLKSLIVEGYLLTPSFDPNIFNYNLDVSKDINEIVIKGSPNDKLSKIEGLGKYDVMTGNNTYTIKVISENGNISNYKINVNKNKGSSILTDLKIEGYPIEFKSDIYTYNIDVKNNIDKIKIDATTNEDAQIEILNDGKLNVGSNEILIRVTSKDKTSTTYKLIVNRLEKIPLINKELIKKILLGIFIILFAGTSILIIYFIKNNRKKERI